jgi:hypothetical protein
MIDFINFDKSFMNPSMNLEDLLFTDKTKSFIAP